MQKSPTHILKESNCIYFYSDDSIITYTDMCLVCGTVMIDVKVWSLRSKLSTECVYEHLSCFTHCGILHGYRDYSVFTLQQIKENF